MTHSCEEKNDITNEQEQHDDDNDGILDIGQQIQAHIPNILLNNLNILIDRKGHIFIPNERKYNNTTLLFLDVSGFTSLTERYSYHSHLGIDQLTCTLNSYFDKLVYEILIHDGDLYKFAGDAILALWLNDTIGPQQALKCALHLQQKYGTYETDVGVILRIKVALAYGPVQILFIGTDAFRHYFLTGDCVKKVKISEQLCEPGDIIITKAVYDQIQTKIFDCEFIPVSDDIDPKREYIVVKYSQSGQSSSNDESDTEDHISSTTMINDRMDMLNQEITNDNNNQQISEDDLSPVEFFHKLDSLMKSFLIRCVDERIEHKQSLYYLTELRRVTISFINLDIPNEQIINDNICEIIHKIFVQIDELTKIMGGVLTKGLSFDKGWSFLCVFGLPGYKQGDDTANALKSAQMIHSTISHQFKFVEKCSIGVATGLTYCGVVGNRARCEYTVIGGKVNMAARLMCNYPNIISCDQETYHNSRLHSQFFQILPDKNLKGMNNVGVIWHYSDYHNLLQKIEENKISLNNQISDIQHEDYPLLDRKIELMTVAAQITLLDEPINSSNRRRDITAISFEGEDEIGRSRLLKFIADSLENSNNTDYISDVSYYDHAYIPNNPTINSNNTFTPISNNETGSISSLNNHVSDSSIVKRPTIQVITHCCRFEQRFNEFVLLRSLLKQLLQFHNNEKTQYEREQYLLRLFDITKENDLYLRKNLFLLNDLLDVGFSRSHIETENTHDLNLLETYESNINELVLHIINKLIGSPNSIGELYSPTSLGNITNTCPVYSGSRISFGSTRSLTSSSTISIVSKIIFIIDDIHFADESSLKHLPTLGRHSKCLLILSMKLLRNNRHDRSISKILRSISTDSRVYLRRLHGLELRYLATLACQMLCVHRVPVKLVKVFNEICNGIPGFCEQVLFDLLNQNKIYIVDNNNEDVLKQESYLIEGDADKLLSNNPIKNSLFKICFSRRKQEITAEQRKNERAFSRVCLLRDPNENDFTADCQQNFQNYIMCRIDSLSEGESLLIKIASVIGNTFSRTFLWSLVDLEPKKLININSCILHMMQGIIIECAFSKQQITKTRTIKCYCLQNPAGLPSECRLMAFTRSTIREGIYNSLTDSLKRLLTRNAINYLETNSIVVCLTCGLNRKNDSPFLVHEHDGLAKIIKYRQQYDFIDIHKIAALKEIDNTIKELSCITNSSVKQHPTKSKIFLETISATSDNQIINEINSANNNLDKHRNTIDVRCIESPHLKKFLSQFSFANDNIINEEVFDTTFSSLPQYSNDPNLTLINVFTPDTPSKLRVNVQRSLSLDTPTKASQIFSLFRIPKREQTNASISNTEILETVEGVVTDNNLNKAETIVEGRAILNEDTLLEQSMFSIELMEQISNDLNYLNKQISLIRTFETLYDHSLLFHTFQSYVHHHNLIKYVYELKQNEQLKPDLNNYAREFNLYQDLRTCKCPDYVMSVYIKLVEYHTNLYDIYEKMIDNKRDVVLSKQFDRIMYYRIEICQLLLRCNCLQRLLVEIENGKKFLEKFHNDINHKQDFSYQYQYFLIKYAYNFFHATFLQHSRATNDSEQLCDQYLKELNKEYQNKIWKNLISSTQSLNSTSTREKKQQYEHSKDFQSKDSSMDYNSSRQSSIESNSDQFVLFNRKYHLEYLLCQYNLLQYNLSHQQSIDSINALIDLQYYRFPLSFSLPCTISLVEYFYYQMNYNQCLKLINKIIHFWWSYVNPREKLEFAKLKCLSLIIELRHGSLNSAIVSGYFAKRILAGYHENVFLIQSCMHLTLALIGEMRISNIESILQHLEYVSEQIMNVYAKLWYYILVIDVAMELGYELLPIKVDLINNIAKYRKKLCSRSNDRILMFVYSDCILAQIYARLGLLDMSKIYFHQALYQIKYDQMHLCKVDFLFKRSLLKLTETQLLHWYHTKEYEEFITINYFLLNQLNTEEFTSWNKSRFFIYQAYYDRLINDYRREKNFSIDNDFNWETSLREAEKYAIKLDSEWIKRLRNAWLHPVSEQFSLQGKTSIPIGQPRQLTVPCRKTNRRFVRSSVPQIKVSLQKDLNTENTADEQSKTIDSYSKQTFVDWRLFINNNNLSQFQLYILPVRV